MPKIRQTARSRARQLASMVEWCGCDNCLGVVLAAARDGVGVTIIRRRYEEDILQIPMYTDNEGEYGLEMQPVSIARFDPETVRMTAQEIHAQSSGHTLQ